MAREEERDGLFYSMYEQQQQLMEFMHASQEQNDHNYQTIIEAQVVTPF